MPFLSWKVFLRFSYIFILCQKLGDTIDIPYFVVRFPMMLKVIRTNLTHFFNRPPGEIVRRAPEPGSFGGSVMTGALVMDTTAVADGRSGGRCDTEKIELVVSIGDQ